MYKLLKIKHLCLMTTQAKSIPKKTMTSLTAINLDKIQQFSTVILRGCSVGYERLNL